MTHFATIILTVHLRKFILWTVSLKQLLLSELSRQAESTASWWNSEI